MVSIVSCLSGTALTGRTARKTLIGILQLIVFVSLITKQTNAETESAAACYGWQFDPPPRCDGGSSVNVLRVTIRSDACKPYKCCPGSLWCEVSAEKVEKAFYRKVMRTCHGRRDCDGLRAPRHWTSLNRHCEENDDSRDRSDHGGRFTGVYAKYVKIQYNCMGESPASRTPSSWTTTTPDEDLTPETTTWKMTTWEMTTWEMTTWADFQTLVIGSRESDPVTLYDVTTDSGGPSGRGSSSDQVGVTVGVTVAVLVVVGVITAVLVIYFLRRRRKQMERQIGKDAMASQATPVPNSYDNAFYQEVIPSAPPPTPGGTTRDPPPLDPTASSGNPHPSSPGAAQDTDYGLVRSPYAKVQRPTSQDSEYDLRLMENPTYN